MEFKDLLDVKEGTLKEMLAESRAKWHDLRLKLFISQQKDLSAHKKIRREIARLNTRLNQKDSN
jgi:ribosomal protein L29